MKEIVKTTYRCEKCYMDFPTKEQAEEHEKHCNNDHVDCLKLTLTEAMSQDWFFTEMRPEHYTPVENLNRVWPNNHSIEPISLYYYTDKNHISEGFAALVASAKELLTSRKDLVERKIARLDKILAEESYLKKEEEDKPKKKEETEDSFVTYGQGRLPRIKGSFKHGLD